MIINKKLIQKIITEEIKNALAMTKKLKRLKEPKKEDSLRRNLINLFIKYREIVEKNTIADKESIVPQFRKELMLLKKKFNVQLKGKKLGEFFIAMLIDHADPQLLTFAKMLLNSDKMRADKMDDYTVSISPEEEKYAPHNLPFRNIKSTEAYGNKVDDVRRFRNN
jgi:hypothetical protein